MTVRTAAVFALLFAAATAPGCGAVFYRGPRGVEGAIERQLDCKLNRQFGLKLGVATSSIASGVLRAAADDEDGELVGDLRLRGVGVAVFEVERQGGHPRRLDPGKLGLAGWDTVLRVKDDGDQVLVMSRPGRRSGVEEAVLVAYDGEEVVVVRVQGELDGLIRGVAEAARSDSGR